MADRVYLSLWVRGYDASGMLDHLARLLAVFPFSRLRQGIRSLEVYALEYAEPPLVEILFDQQTDAAGVIQAAHHYVQSDVALLIEGYWELWRWTGEWKLEPSPITIECFGPGFNRDADDHLRLCLGVDEDFLPRDDVAGSSLAISSNIRSLLRLVEDIGKALPVKRRSLWLESGGDLAARIQQQLD